MDISCILLAGGKSLRLGHDKVLEDVGNKSLLEQVMSRIDSLGREIIIVTTEERTLSHLVSRSKWRTVSDILPVLPDGKRGQRN
jgi:molybdopterin-guanine dinucleotide biosynthesis protein A